MGYFSIKELGLPENSWSAFETHHHTVPFPPGKLIYLQGSPADRFYYLKSGRVKVFINSEDGSEKILTVYEAGNVFGEASFFDELPRVSSAVTVTRCEIVVIDRPTLGGGDAAEPANPPDHHKSAGSDGADAVRPRGHHGLFKGGSAHCPLPALRAGGRGTRHPLHPQEEIAAAVSVSRVTASRVLNRFVRCGLLQTGYGSLRILDASGLEQCARQGFEA